MADTIRLKRSAAAGAVPAAAQLELGELAVNAADGSLFLKKTDGSVAGIHSKKEWDALKAPAIAAGVLIIDLSAPAGFRVALNQNVTTLSFANVPTGRVVVFTITWVQDATGGRTVAFPASVKADGGGAPVQPASAANSVTVQSFYTDDGGATIWQASSGSNKRLTRMALTADATAANAAPTVVPYNTLIEGLAEDVVLAQGRFRPKLAGRYFFFAVARLDPVRNYDYGVLGVRKNGAAPPKYGPSFTFAGPVNYDINPFVMGIEYLNGNDDFLDFVVFLNTNSSSSPGTRVVMGQPNFTYLFAYRID